jgi:hypothetical protein
MEQAENSTNKCIHYLAETRKTARAIPQISHFDKNNYSGVRTGGMNPACGQTRDAASAVVAFRAVLK